MRVPAVIPCMRPVLDVLVLSGSFTDVETRALPGTPFNLPGAAKLGGQPRTWMQDAGAGSAIRSDPEGSYASEVSFPS